MFGIALGPWGPFLSGVWSFATSRLGNVLMAATVAYAIGHHRANKAWEARNLAEHMAAQRAHFEEMQREFDARVEIAKAATARAQEDAASAASMQHEIDLLKAVEPINVPPLGAPRACILDDDFAQRVRRLDAAGHRAPAPPRRP